MCIYLHTSIQSPKLLRLDGSRHNDCDRRVGCVDDADDEMILEAAFNAHDRTIVTFNTRDFVGATERFGVRLAAPREILEKRT